MGNEKNFLKDMFDYISLRIRGGLSSTKVSVNCYRIIKNDDYADCDEIEQQLFTKKKIK